MIIQTQKTPRSELKRLFKTFEKLKVLVIGDVMLDHYMIGKVTRLSPEAPVPIVNISNKEFRLGGAANVVANLQAMGNKPIICSVVGNDLYGSVFCKLLEKQGLSNEGIIIVNDRKTTVKTRVIGNNHQLIRIDEEQDDVIDRELESRLLKIVQSILEREKIDVIIFEDYDKGVLSRRLIENVIKFANQKNIPTAVDPKKRNFLAFKGCTLFKPNLKELKEGLKIEIDPLNENELKKASELVLNQLGCRHLLLTLSEYGVLFANKKSMLRIPAHLRSIADVSGAGDTVVSIAALCLGANAPSYLLAQLANIAGGLVCEHVGVVPINREQLFEEAVKHLSK